MMPIGNTPTRFGSLGVFFHWSVVLMVISQFVLVHFAQDAEDKHNLMGQIAWLARHKSMGITILAFATLRLLWRWLSPPPPFPAGMPNWQRLAGRGNHVVLYALLFALPLTGWAMSSAANFSVSYFHLFTLPNFVSPDKGLKQTLENVHGLLATLLMIFAAIHVVAALKHHFFDRDGVLLRMLGREAV